MTKEQVKSHIKNVLKLLKYKAVDFQILDVPKKEMGDVATNIAFLLAKDLKKKPDEIAEKIAYKLAQQQVFEKIEVVNGYINIFLKQEDLSSEIISVIKNSEDFSQTSINKNQKIQVEFISANPTGPLTIGNSRGGVIGDVISNVLENTGAKVIREYYFNDAGGQIDSLGHSILKDKNAVYKGEYIDELNKKYKTKKEFKDKDFKKIGKMAAKEIIEMIKETVKRMGIEYDVWFAEGKDLRDTGKVEKVINSLITKKLAYKKDGAVWFKASKFGDEKDRVIVRKNGEPTYFGVDCAYHTNKFIERGFDKVINIWGADHHGDVARVKGFVKSIGHEKDFEILLHQFVKIVKDGKEYRMSKRKGNYVLVSDLLDEVGKDAYRFFMLSYAMNSHLVFDIDLAKKKSSENPVFYVQYAYARICSIINKVSKKPKIKSLIFEKPEERQLAKKILELPELISDISQNYQVHKLTTYAIDLARSFHAFYEKCPILKANDGLKNSRIQILYATQVALKTVLDIMGISAPKKM